MKPAAVGGKAGVKPVRLALLRAQASVLQRVLAVVLLYPRSAPLADLPLPTQSQAPLQTALGLAAPLIATPYLGRFYL